MTTAASNTDPEAPTNRLFLIGAGFSKAAGLPLAKELLPLVRCIAEVYFRSGGYSHLEDAIERYEAYVADVDPGRSFDLEQFGAWLDWEHVLRLKGSDTFSEYGNQAGLQLRWAIGKALHDAMPREIPQLYIDFVSRLTTSDRILTLNYDLLLERALDAVGLAYRRFPMRYSEVHEMYATGDLDHAPELVLCKLHGSIDWTYARRDADAFSNQARPLAEGPRPVDDPLNAILVMPTAILAQYYASEHSWWRHPPILFPPSTAKPLAGSPLVPLWDGVGLYANMLGGFGVIGCSLPAGDPYVVQLVHHIATDYVAGRESGGRLWPQRRMTVVDLRGTPDSVAEIEGRFRFMNRSHTDFILSGFTPENLGDIFQAPDIGTR